MISANCPQCGTKVSVRIQDDSFDYGSSHQGPAGIETIITYHCSECDTEISCHDVQFSDGPEADWPTEEEHEKLNL